MKRFKIITYKGDIVKRNIPSSRQALYMAVELTKEFGIKKSFLVQVDKLATFAYSCYKTLRILYLPVYYVGVILLMVTRLVLALAYLLMLRGKISKMILQNMFVWQH